MEFKNYSFKDLLSHIVDNRGKTCPVENIGIPLIATNCIKDDSLYAEYERIRFVSDDTYKTWFRGHPEPEDIIFVCKGSPGRVAWVQNPVPYCIAQDMVAIRANKSLIDSKFLFALLRNPSTQKSILNMHVGTMIPHFKKGDFSNLYFDIPQDLAYQKWAGELYFSFSEKIELNKQTNQTLEQMAQALFKSWFVDFDPVFDNAFDAGLSVDDLPDELQQRAMVRQQHRFEAMQQDSEAIMPQTPQSTAVLQPQNQQAAQTESDRIRGLFPNEFEQCDDPSVGINGWIPKGWKIKSVDDLNRINPESWTKKNTPKNVMYVDLANAKNGTILEPIEYSFEDAPSRARRVLQKHDIIIGVVRPANRSFAYVNENGLTGSTGFAVVRALNDSYRAFTYLTLTNDDSITEFARIADGAAYPAIKPEDVAKATCLYSSDELLESFEKIVGQLLLKKAANEQQLKPLGTLRDTLLPKLISGELKFSEAVQSIETK